MASERARRADRFLNRRAEVFWALREAMREGLVDLDPADEELASQLLAIRFHETSRGLIQIEAKADMRKRGVSSPDRADALAMTFATAHWRPQEVLSDEERSARDLEQIVARAERAQWAQWRWPDLPPAERERLAEGGSVMGDVLGERF